MGQDTARWMLFSQSGQSPENMSGTLVEHLISSHRFLALHLVGHALCRAVLTVKYQSVASTVPDRNRFLAIFPYLRASLHNGPIFAKIDKTQLCKCGELRSTVQLGIPNSGPFLVAVPVLSPGTPVQLLQAAVPWWCLTRAQQAGPALLCLLTVPPRVSYLLALRTLLGDLFSWLSSFSSHFLLCCWLFLTVITM